jgi:hypothetical protein
MPDGAIKSTTAKVGGSSAADYLNLIARLTPGSGPARRRRAPACQGHVDVYVHGDRDTRRVAELVVPPFESLKFVARAGAYGESTALTLSAVGACTMKGFKGWIERDRPGPDSFSLLPRASSGSTLIKGCGGQ